MELIVTSFLLIGLLLVGDIGSVVSDQLRRPKRRIWRLAEDSRESPPPKRAAPTRFATAVVEPASA